MIRSLCISARPIVRFWRLLFRGTLIHFVIFGFVSVSLFLQMHSDSQFRTFDMHDLGLVNATSLWLFLNTDLMSCALVGGDAAALYVSWRSARRMPMARPVAFALLLVALGLCLLHCAGTVNAGRIGTFHSPHTTYVIGGDVVRSLVVRDFLFALPALLAIAGLLLCGGPTRAQGLCVSCGYDLTGNVSGACPECGAPIPAEAKA